MGNQWHKSLLPIKHTLATFCNFRNYQKLCPIKICCKGQDFDWVQLANYKAFEYHFFSVAYGSQSRNKQWWTLNWLLGGGGDFNYQDNIETDHWFKCNDTINFIVKKVNHCCFSGTGLQIFSLILLGVGANAHLVSATRNNVQISKKFMTLRSKKIGLF